MTRPEMMAMLEKYNLAGRLWVSCTEAAEVLGCQPESLRNAANRKGTLGSLQYFWAGTSLKISTASLIHFICGGYPMREIFGGLEVR